MGLEAQNGLLFLSETGIHIICGIVADDASQKISDIIFNWVPIGVQNDNLRQSGSKTIAIDDLPDDEWLKFVWKDFLEAELMHYKFPTDEVRF
jgi:hypothetical protein